MIDSVQKNIQAANAASKLKQAPAEAQTIISAPRAAYGILQFIMRHTYILTAILGVCLAAAGQTSKQQARPKSPAATATSAKPQAPSDEELMAKTAQTTIDWDKSTSPGIKTQVLLVKKDQNNGKPFMQYRLKISALPKTSFIR